nr:zinc metalloproteinase-disintegrin-like protein H4 subunit A [Nothobranchius furzeri]
MIHGTVTGQETGHAELTVNMFPWLVWVCFAQTSGLLSHVQQYEVVRPQRHQERRTRSLLKDQLYPEKVQYDLKIEGRNHTINLEKNRNLIGERYIETVYSEDGKRMTGSPSQEHCFYHGHVQDQVDSSVSVGICSGIRGFLRVQQQVYMIEPLGRTDDEDHAVYRWEHLKVGGQLGCGPSSLLYDQNQNHNQDRAPQHAGLFTSRSWNTKPLPGPERFVELVVVVDNTEYKLYGKETKSRILGVVNHMDKLYRPLNIHIVLVGLDIWSYKDYIHVDEKPETTLDNFLLWRKAELLPRMKHDNAQFVTGKKFANGTVGLANKFAMCTENSAGVSQDHLSNPLGLASTIAHEMGHNFGLSHDSASCVCGPFQSSTNCVMTEKLETANQAFPEFFSNCSLQQLSEFMARAQPSCLHQPILVRTIAAGPLCGNGLLDPREECDCGTEQECDNPCCDASTCRLTEGSECAHGQCCEQCKLKASGTVCRGSAGDCDLPEYCTGESQDCPEDSFEMNGKGCYNHMSGFCYDGQCPSLHQHCWRLFGDGAKIGPDFCFNLNRQGMEGTNCGGNKSRFIPCSSSNLKCGSIFCTGGGESITGKRAGYTMFGVECKVAVEDDKSRNIDMVPSGTVCGTNKVCLGNRCVDVSVFGKKEECAKKCNNNGVCNHKNQCHCDPGWAPPYCEIKYADLPKGRSMNVAGVCAAVSTLLVILLLIVGLLYCKKNNIKGYISRRKKKSAPRKLNPKFQATCVKERPEIGQPTLVESTVSLINSPLVLPVVPSRPAPPQTGSPLVTKHQKQDIVLLQPPRKPTSLASTCESESSKESKPSLPPVPPVKPSPLLIPRIKPSPPAPPRPPAKPQLHRLM